MKISKKVIALMLSTMLIIGCVVGGTVAWLVDKTNPVTNVFTAGDINITLTESENLDLKMVPGASITKDPKITVAANSEDCWLFVKVDKENTFDEFMEYSIAQGWTELETGVYYRSVSRANTAQDFQVINSNQITVKSSVTKEELRALTGSNNPKLTFTAYAVQKVGFDTAAGAWTEAEKL